MIDHEQNLPDLLRDLRLSDQDAFRDTLEEIICVPTAALPGHVELRLRTAEHRLDHLAADREGRESEILCALAECDDAESVYSEFSA